MPEWNKRNFSVLNAQSLKEGWLDKDLSFVLLDVRPEKEAKAGFIKGAVSIPEKSIDKALKSFPSKDLKPPIVVYDARGDGTAEKVAMKLVKAGCPGPRVLTGGFAGWQGAKYAVETGNPATQVAYVPKPKAGSIPATEFRAFAKGVPADVQIIDVREEDEIYNTGMIKAALNIPAGEIASRLAEIPKDKTIVMHCSTGARAEMAYNVLKDKGYKVRFLDATVTNKQDGSFEVK